MLCSVHVLTIVLHTESMICNQCTSRSIYEYLVQVMEFCNYGCDVNSGVLQFNIIYGSQFEFIAAVTQMMFVFRHHYETLVSAPFSKEKCSRLL